MLCGFEEFGKFFLVRCAKWVDSKGMVCRNNVVLINSARSQEKASEAFHLSPP